MRILEDHIQFFSDLLYPETTITLIHGEGTFFLPTSMQFQKGMQTTKALITKFNQWHLENYNGSCWIQ